MPHRYMRSILNIFVDSPMDALEDHSKKVIESVDKLSEMLDFYLEGSCGKADELCQVIDDLEHDADKMKQQFQVVLPNSVVIQLDTNDLLSFLKAQDGIANIAQNGAHWMTLRSSDDIPEEIKNELRDLMKMSLKCIRGYEKVMKSLERVEATSYSKFEIQKLVEQIPEIEKQEYEVDVFEIKVLKTIFSYENEIGGAAVYHLARLVDNIGDIADQTARSVDIMRKILIKKT
ncbi:TIGR00153 family protein [Methanimicrococcus sp. OttesenSCG-928-J09]|nr:TIGR00153 family protein [Methanimicrococcus sp. OttesenSCG-928-J09]